MTPVEKELIYIADPMCSWCWGFSPVITQVAELIRDKADLRVLPGGLRTDTQMPLSAHEVGEITHHWQEVAKRTGQPFDFSQPLETSYVYNTGPSCQALSWMIRLRPQCGLDYLRSLQQAFYVGRRDLKDPEVLADYAQTYGVARADFLEQLYAPAAREALAEDLYFVRRCGIEGYPSVLLRSGPRLQKLTIGYQPYEVLHPHLLRWLEPA
ncbi:MAG: DsbA family protein [Panacagrimonas sp.]